MRAKLTGSRVERSVPSCDPPPVSVGVERLSREELGNILGIWLPSFGGNWLPELNLSSLFPPVPALFPEQGSDPPPVPHPFRGEQVGTQIWDGLALNLSSRSFAPLLRP